MKRRGARFQQRSTDPLPRSAHAGRTSLVIAHRLDDLNADVIRRADRGHVESARITAAAREGAYAQLYSSSFAKVNPNPNPRPRGRA